MLFSLASECILPLSRVLLSRLMVPPRHEAEATHTPPLLLSQPCSEHVDDSYRCVWLGVPVSGSLGVFSLKEPQRSSTSVFSNSFTILHGKKKIHTATLYTHNCINRDLTEMTTFGNNNM